MEETVKDAILTGESDDETLVLLIDLTASSIHENRPLFSNLLNEPYVYRKYFSKWVREGILELQGAKKAADDIDV